MKLGLKKRSLTSLALVAVSVSTAQATNYDITSPTAGPLPLTTGDTLTVQSSGSLNATNQNNVQVTGTPSGAIVNNGAITSTGDRAIEVTGTVSGGIDNNEGATINGDGHGIEVNGAITADGNGYAIYNDGTISSNGSVNFPDSSAIRIAGATINGNIFNDTNGIISGYVYGVNLQSGTTVSGGLANSGTISAGTYAVWIDGGTITNGITNNSGGIIGNGIGDGIVIDSSGTLGQITNDGTISTSSGDAIYNQGNLTTLTNTSGTITATTGSAIQNASNIATLNNTGTISATSSGTAIHLTGGTVSTLNNNGGTITATNGYAILSTLGTITSLTNNGGVISATGDGGTAIGNEHVITTLDNTGGTISATTNGIALDNIGTIGTLTNGAGGTITAGNGSYAIINYPAATMDLTNNGLIHATDTVALYNDGTLTLNNTNGTISATTGTAIELDAPLTGTLTNTGGLITSASTGNGTLYVTTDLGNQTIAGGTISNTSNSNGAVAININGSTGESGIITFNGVNVIADGDTAGSGHGTAFLINEQESQVSLAFDSATVIRGAITDTGGDNVALTTAANITGDISLTGGGLNNVTINGGTINGTMFFGSGTTNLEIAAPFTTGGTIATDPNGVTNLIVDNSGSLTVNQAVGLNVGAITVDNGGTFSLVNGDVTTAGALTNHGTTSIGIGRTLSVGSIDTTATDGVLYFTANNSGSTLLTGHINTGSTAANLSNQTVSVNYIGGVGLNSLSRSLIASGTGNATAPVAAVIDNSYLYGFTVTSGTSDPNDLYLQAALLVSPSNASNTQNNANAANILFSPTINSSDPVINQIQTNLLNAPTRQAYNNVVQSTLPTVDHGATSGAANFTGDVFDVADSQLTTVDTGLQTGIAAGNETHGLHPWMQGFGSYANQGMRSDTPGYNAATYGAAFGLDTRELVDDTVLGLSFAYGRTNVNSNNTNNTTTNVNTYQGMIYGNQKFAEDYFFTGMGAFGWDTNDENRQDVGAIAGLDASADYNSWQAATRWEVGRNFKNLPTNMTLTPSLISDYIHYQASGYTETGAGGADLHVGSQAENQLNVGLGLQAEWLFDSVAGSKLRPNLHASYRYDVLNDDAVDTTSSFAAGGGAFTTNGLNPGNSTYDLGAGMKFYNTGNWDFTVTYDHTFKADYNSDSGIIRAAYSF
jgi:outer membrane autotransporter protein